MSSWLGFGPKDKNLWLNRPLGHYEKTFLLPIPSMQVPKGPVRFTINSLFHLETNPDFEFKVDAFQKSVRATIYKQPHLRTRVDLHSAPIRWLPAEDFDDVFCFLDRSRCGRGRGTGDGKNNERLDECVDGNVDESVGGNLEEVWDLVEEATNKEWDYDSFKPLYRCTLIKMTNGYVVMNTYHHAVADSRSGMHAMSDILEFYEDFDKGVDVKPVPLPLRGSTDEESFLFGHDSILDKMTEMRIEMSKTLGDPIPFDVSEAVANDSLGLPLAKTFFHEGAEANLEKLKSRCRKEKVTVGSLAIAARHFSVCVLRALQVGEEFNGIKDHFTVIPVDMRPRLNNPIGSLCAFYVIDLIIKNEVALSTNLWDHAREVKRQLDQAFEEKQHLLTIQAMKEWETGPTAAFAAAEDTSFPWDVVSNVGIYRGRKEFPWGKIRCMHTSGFLHNFLILLQSTDRMTYDILSTSGDNNEATAHKSLQVVVDLMENAGDEDREDDLRSVLRRNGIDL